MAYIEFSVIAETPHGGTVRVVGSPESLGRWEPRRGLELQTDPGNYPCWSATVRISQGSPPTEYKFVLVKADHSAIWEDGPNRRLDPSASGPAEAQTPVFRKEGFAPAMDIRCVKPVAWTHDSPSSARLSSFGGGDQHDFSSEGRKQELWIEAACSKTAPGDAVRVVGSEDVLGGWDPSRGVQLTTTASSFPYWSGNVFIPYSSCQVEWKLVIIGVGGKTTWEPADNRCTKLPGSEGAWVVRVHWGGHCTAPEPCSSSVCRSQSQPLMRYRASTGAIPTTSLRRNSMPVPVVSSSSMVGLQHVAPVPSAAPPVSSDCSEAIGTRQWTRRRSMSHLGSMLPDAATSDPTSLGRSRAAAAMEGQLVTLTVGGVDPLRAAATVVEVVFESDGSRWRAHLDPQGTPRSQVRWSVSLVETGLQTGLHHLHFVVGGKRVLSRDLPVFGESNVVLFSDSIRRYVLARDERKQESAVASAHDLQGNSSTVARNLPRPFSICGNLTTLGDEEEEPSSVDANQSMGCFCEEVFEGLYDSELRFRIDGYVVPGSLTYTRPLRFWAGAQLLKKKVGACEDAYFAEEHALGVADGVGCMVQFAPYGINAAAYAAELMTHAATSLRKSRLHRGKQALDTRTKAAVQDAEDGVEAYGASTILVMAIDGTAVSVSNLGDSGFLHLRKGPRGMQVVKRSEEQQHNWNCPYQLTRLPQALLSRFPKLSVDTAADCDQYNLSVHEGDLIIAFTDGLRDNLHEREILHIVDCALPPTFAEMIGLREQSTTPDRLARSLALGAQERSLDITAKVPFSEYSKKHGYEYQGGKQDDITVVVAWVVSEEPPDIDRVLTAIAEASVEAGSAAANGPGEEELAEAIARAEALKLPSVTMKSGANLAGIDPSEVELESVILRTEALTTGDTELSAEGAAGGGAPSPSLALPGSCPAGLDSEGPARPTYETRPSFEKPRSVSTVMAAPITGSCPAGLDGKGPAHPSYETRPSFEKSRSVSMVLAAPVAGDQQRRLQTCRAEFRPMSSGSKTHDASRGRRGAQSAVGSRFQNS